MMCNCFECMMSEEAQHGWEEAYQDWEYQKYCEQTENPLNKSEWLRRQESVS